jgi:NAD(P)-dependent dehydrogenase (short-subunit alcohol dehydrogenase family)
MIDAMPDAEKDASVEAGKAILITGAASGIGLATARFFAGRGWIVGALDVNGAALDALRDAVGAERIFARAVDVSDRQSLLAAVEAFGARSGGRLDLLFANAGIDAKGRFDAMAWDRVVSVIGVNLLGALSLVHAALPMLKATPGSLCLSTASASAIFGTANMAVYSASKHAIRGFTEALAVELAPAGVRAADLLPGIIDTGMLDPAQKAALPATGMLRVLSAEAIAEAVLAAYRGDKLHWYVPEELAAYDIEVTTRPEAARDRRIAGGI